MRAIWPVALGATVLAAASLPRAAQAPVQTAAQTLPSAQARMVGAIKILNIRNSVYLLQGAGGNITVLAFPEGVTIIDSGASAMADQVLAAIRTISTQPIRYIINTSVDPDHAGGNEKLASVGRQITGGNFTAPDQAEVIAHEQVLNRMLAPSVQPPTPSLAVPATTYYTPTLKLSTLYHGDAVQLVHVRAAHTDGDTMVWLRHNDIIATGDIFQTTNYPVIDLERGGGINGVIEGLNQVIDIAFPEFRLENGTLIVPGHGRLCDIADVVYYRDMVTIIRDRVDDMVKKGAPLDQVKAAKLTRDYDPYYTQNAATYSPEMFIESVYKSLAPKPAPARPAAPARGAAPAPRR